MNTTMWCESENSFYNVVQIEGGGGLAGHANALVGEHSRYTPLTLH